MENNIENEATKESNAESEENVVDQISTCVLGLLGQIEDFVSSLQDDTSSSELAVHPRAVPSRLENAVRLISMARDEVSAELGSYNLFGLVEDERKNNENQSKSIEQSEVMKSHIDDCIKLGNVRNEMSRVMDTLSARMKLMRAQGSQNSYSDTADVEDAMAAVDSGICSSDTEGSAAGLVHVQDVVDLPTIGEVEQSIQATALNVSKLAINAKKVCEEVDKIVQKHRSIASSVEAGSKEMETDEVREKSDYEETEKSDCTLVDKEEECDVKVATFLGVEAADSSCSEYATEDETEAETTSDDEHADKTEMGQKARLNGMPNSLEVLNEHAMKDGVSVQYDEYYKVNSEVDDSPQSSRYNFRCRILDMEAKGEGRNRAVAMLRSATNMLSLLVGRQVDGTLTPLITPFTPAQLKYLDPILSAKVESSSISVLRTECRRIGEKMPRFTTLSRGGPSGEQIFTVQCTALNHTAVGCGGNKRRARRDAAKQIMDQCFKSAVDQE